MELKKQKIDLNFKLKFRKDMDKVIIFHCEYQPNGIPKNGI